MSHCDPGPCSGRRKLRVKNDAGISIGARRLSQITAQSRRQAYFPWPYLVNHESSVFLSQSPHHQRQTAGCADAQPTGPFERRHVADFAGIGLCRLGPASGHFAAAPTGTGPACDAVRAAGHHPKHSDGCGRRCDREGRPLRRPKLECVALQRPERQLHGG